jgi:hypothetical protein
VRYHKLSVEKYITAEVWNRGTSDKGKHCSMNNILYGYGCGVNSIFELTNALSYQVDGEPFLIILFHFLIVVSDMSSR